MVHLTGEPAVAEVLIDAGRTLALRRQAGGYLASFVGPQSLFIDVMMNVGIIFWAANAEPDDDTLRAIGLEHCRTTARYLVRPDGGTAHEGIFDAQTGQFLRETTHQGWRADSTWTRGLAWAIYGFTAVHRLSGEPEFLEWPGACAACYLRSHRTGWCPLGLRLAERRHAVCGTVPPPRLPASGLWDLAEATRRTTANSGAIAWPAHDAGDAVFGTSSPAGAAGMGGHFDARCLSLSQGTGRR